MLAVAGVARLRVEAAKTEVLRLRLRHRSLATPATTLVTTAFRNVTIEAEPWNRVARSRGSSLAPGPLHVSHFLTIGYALSCLWCNGLRRCKLKDNKGGGDLL